MACFGQIECRDSEKLIVFALVYKDEKLALNKSLFTKSIKNPTSRTNAAYMLLENKDYNKV